MDVIRMLKVIDCYTRESQDIHLDQSLNGEHVVRVLNNIVAIRGKPWTITTYNGGGFISKVMENGLLKDAAVLQQTW